MFCRFMQNWIRRIPTVVDLVIHEMNTKKKEIQKKVGDKMSIYTAIIEAYVEDGDPTSLDESYKRRDDISNRGNLKRRLV